MGEHVGRSQAVSEARAALVGVGASVARLYCERLVRGGVTVVASPLDADVVVCVGGGSRDETVESVRRACGAAGAGPTRCARVLALVPATEIACVRDIVAAGATAVLAQSAGYLDQLAPVVWSLASLGRAAEAASHLGLREALDGIRDENRTLHALIDRLESMAMSDPLTGLANRRAIDTQLSGLFASAARHGSELACMMIDLDNLKLVNDTLGHAAGDELILAAAHALRAECRQSDVAGRIGGDEFVVLLPHTSVAAAERLAERVRRRFQVNAREIARRLGADRCEIGLCIGTAGSENAETHCGAGLLLAADASLYQGKRSAHARSESRAA